MTSIDTLLDKKFGALNDTETAYLSNINRIQKKLKGRVNCTMLFKNNLEGAGYSNSNNPVNFKIKYLKLGHVLEGQECFVYERVNIENQRSEQFENYIIGSSIADSINEGKIEIKEVKNNSGMRAISNVYDKLYVQFVIEKEIDGKMKEIVYNQSYTQFLAEELLDLFSVSGNLTDEMLSLMNIQLFFKPGNNIVNNTNAADDLKLQLAISMPCNHVIHTDATIID